jgi:hypothetical protein
MRSRTSSAICLRLLTPVLLSASLSAAQASARAAFVDADAGEDLAVACTMNGASVTLDGTGSTVEGDPAAGVAGASFAWEAKGVVFDDPSSPTPTASFPPGTTSVTLTVTWQPPAPPVCVPGPPVCGPEPGCVPGLEDPLCICGPGAPICEPGLPGPPESSHDDVEVQVADTTPPVISAVATPAELRPANNTLRQVDVQIHAEDTCSTELAVELVSLTSSEPDGAADATADIQQAEIGADDRQFLLRAESLGRIYAATYRATDRAGNHSDAVARVRVSNDKSPTFTQMSDEVKAAKKAKKAKKKKRRKARRAALRDR